MTDRTECTNPSKPCHLHDPRNEWRIELGGRTVNVGWLIAVGVIVIALTTLPGLN